MLFTEITDSGIKLDGVSFKDDGDKIQAIMEICHRYKHLYLDGYPCGHKTRKAQGLRLKKWGECPQICFTYYATNDTDGHNLAIQVVVSDMENLQKRYTIKQIEEFRQKFLLDVSRKIADL